MEKTKGGDPQANDEAEAAELVNASGNAWNEYAEKRAEKQVALAEKWQVGDLSQKAGPKRQGAPSQRDKTFAKAPSIESPAVLEAVPPGLDIGDCPGESKGAAKAPPPTLRPDQWIPSGPQVKQPPPVPRVHNMTGESMPSSDGAQAFNSKLNILQKINVLKTYFAPTPTMINMTNEAESRENTDGDDHESTDNFESVGTPPNAESGSDGDKAID